MSDVLAIVTHAIINLKGGWNKFALYFEMLRDLCQNHNNEDILMICSLLPFPFCFIEGENNLNQEYQTLWLFFDI